MITYLSERLTKFVEQTVLPGTLRRMFGISKWLFVFDGLDEVPGDIKDGVSKQITKFTNDTLIGLKSDGVIVCTSRPQGYSGQFASLDAAVLELSKLSPKQALACAAPVLRIDRSAEDSSNYYKILKEALSSPAVQEIMTTPLQAHIMAVVVRDGSKPPERKWQLFTKFYNVIKQREANHSLPKPSLARLLQEGDTLLKAIHNRLGFELHKRAETKQGANTFLTRVEFEGIARETVIELQEDKIDETVAILMEATTERLVLVNTPENGNQVKFDIRPLQEFFSAEYIYESVDSERFSQRIRLIAEDSHWREVMHFLLSALVENGRQAELSIAVQVLNEINGSSLEDDLRLLSRRVAIGSLISCRLLEEGVLDQDKRVRNRFSDCIEPILGSCEAVDGLIQARGAHTLSWLISLLMRQLTEKTESENIGSAVILSNIVTDQSPHVGFLFDYLSNSSPSYKAALFSLLNERDLEERPLPKWLVRLLVNVKLDKRWFELRQTGIDAVDSLLSSVQAHIPEASRELGIAPPIDTLCQFMLIDLSMPYGARSGKVESTENLFDILTVIHHKPSEELDHHSFSDQVWEGLSKTTGYLQTCYRLFRLASQRNQENFNLLLETVNGNPENLCLLNEDVFAWLPQEYVAKIGHQDGWRAWISRSMKSTREGSTCRISFSHGQLTGKGKWNKFLEAAPTMAAHLLIDERYIQPQPFLSKVFQKKVNQLALTRGFERCPSNAASMIGLWGKILEEAPAYRERLRAVMKGWSGVPPSTGSAGGEIFPFPLRLTTEASLLPHIINRISQRVSYVHVEERMEAIESEPMFSSQRCVAEYVDDPRQLLEISGDEDQERGLRAAAAMIYIRPVAKVG